MEDNTLQIDNTVQSELVSYVQSHTTNAKLFSHKPSKTSEESREARAEATGEYVIGAKALLLKFEMKSNLKDTFALVVLPGTNKLDSKRFKEEIRSRSPLSKDFRFASAEEMLQIARGMQPGMMPPFGRPIFPLIEYTYIDENLAKYDKIGFNAADFERSFIMPTSEYLGFVVNDGIFPCSMEKDTSISI